MVTSSNGKIFRVTGLMCGKFTGHRWIPHTKASDAELWCFFDLRNSWRNNGDAGDLRRHCTHYDVIVMLRMSLGHQQLVIKWYGWVCATRPEGYLRIRIRVSSNQHDTKRVVNTLRPGQNGCNFADDSFKRIFMNENNRISIEISLKFVPKGLFNNIPALVLIMAWRRPGDKPLSEPMMVRSLTHICVTRPQWECVTLTGIPGIQNMFWSGLCNQPHNDHKHGWCCNSLEYWVSIGISGRSISSWRHFYVIGYQIGNS